MTANLPNGSGQSALQAWSPRSALGLGLQARINPAIHGRYKTESIHRKAPWETKESLELAMLAGV